MKKIFVLVLLVLVFSSFISSSVWAIPGQWSANTNSIYYNDGPVGLGTSTPDPAYKITTLGGTVDTAKYPQFKIQHNPDRFWRIRTLAYGNPEFGSYGLEIAQPAQDYPGCAGCGGDLVLAPFGEVIMMSMNNATGQKTKVGINTAKPTKDLSVNGTILAREVLVSNAAANWPDYVFEEDYDLMSLEEVETYIKQNKHLPKIPNQKEIAEEGISLGEMQKLHMEKIEELTLYILQLEERIAKLEEK